jgi:CRISPR-associated protein Cmr3
MTKRLKFSAFDTLFFREARPMESVGAKPLQGRFPPTARSVSGVIRTLTGEAIGVDWSLFGKKDPSQDKIAATIGAADSANLGLLKMRGPFPMLNDERLYPAPLHCLSASMGDKTEYVFLNPGSPVTCDLGNVYLPELQEALPGAKPLENFWLTQVELQRVLSGKPPKEVVAQDQLFIAEPRLGIALDHGKRSAKDGMLYQTIHARPKPETMIGVEVDGIPDNVTLGSIVRLGGEGRFAAVETGSCAQSIQTESNLSAKGIVLVLITAAHFFGDWLPPGFTRAQDEQGASVWQGEISGISLTLRCAVIGKAVREGGWDMQKHCSRPAVNLIPAGSVYFCTVNNGDMNGAAAALQGKQIGNETEFGRGELAVGYW